MYQQTWGESGGLGVQGLLPLHNSLCWMDSQTHPLRFPITNSLERHGIHQTLSQRASWKDTVVWRARAAVTVTATGRRDSTFPAMKS